jgi:FKBP-type peptidyl-prolyl cis-trans isomerase
MKNIVGLLIVGIVLISCDTSGVKKDPIKKEKVTKEVKQKKNILDEVQDVKDSKALDNGIKIKWFKHGSGENIKYSEVIKVDYKVSLRNGEVIDGNHLIKKESVPFIVGFGMQTPGWDIALKELKVGDFAEIHIPAKLARGDKEVKGLFPANSDNILKIRVLENVKPTRERDGNKAWVFEENKANKLKFSEENTVIFHCMSFTPTNPLFVNTYRTNSPFSMKLEDNGVVPGLKKALINAKKGDRMLVFVPSSEAYKDKGFQDVVKPNEDLMYNILILDVAKD